MKKNNPFTLAFGKPPVRLINRYEDIDNIVTTFDADYTISYTYLIEGVRGGGKTVLMSTVANELKKDDSWIIVNLNSTQDLLYGLAKGLENTVKNIPDFLEKGFNLSVLGVGIGIGADDKEKDNISVIQDLLSYIKKKNKRLLVTIDEVMHDDNMRAFASQFQIFLREDYPIYVIMTGLYDNIYAIQNDPGLTFLLRSPKIRIEPLSLSQITRQYMQIFDIEKADAKMLADVTKGYAFAFQALGLLYWEYRDELSFDEILIKFDDMLDGYVYKKIWEGLSKQDKKIIMALEDNKAIATKDLLKRTGIKANSYPKYRERLINKGVVITPEHGMVELALPRFRGIVELY